VTSAAAVLSLPVGGGGFYLGRGFVRPGSPNPADGYTAMFQIVTPGYFHTLATPLLHGRDFDAHDTAASAPVVIINQSLARRQFAGENPIGQKLLVWRDEKVAREVIGVVGDMKPENLADNAPSEMYVPIAQSDCGFMTFVIRTAGDPGSAVPAVKATLQALDGTQAVYGVKSFDTIMRSALARQRFSLWLFAAFAVLALLLAAVGLYAVMSQVVAGRTREMGVRVALGARPTEVRWLVVRQGMSLFAIGLVCGVAVSLAATRLLANLLYDVTPTDPSTLISTALVMCAVAWLSSYVPARRATRLDPATVLRTD
jgi:putative ABC transport system permease protein